MIIITKCKRPPAALNRYEQIDLLKQPNPRAPTGLRNLCIIVLMLKAGLRVSEIINLQKNDFDWNNRTVKVKGSGAATTRVLKIGIEELELLKRWRDKLAVETKYFVATLDGKQLKDRYIREMVKRMAIKAGLEKDVYPHLLRHTFAVDFIRETRDMHLLQKALGHRDPSATQNYARILLNELNNPYTGNEEGERSGFPIDYIDEINQTAENRQIQQNSKDLNNTKGTNLLKENMEKQLSVFNRNNNNKKPVRQELKKDNDFVKTEYKMFEQPVIKRFKNELPEKNKERGRVCHDAESDQGIAPGTIVSEGQQKELKENVQKENVQMKTGQAGKSERVRIPPIKCCFCNYILQFKGDCPQCGASFESIINHWSKQIL